MSSHGIARRLRPLSFSVALLAASLAFPATTVVAAEGESQSAQGTTPLYQEVKHALEAIIATMPAGKDAQKLKQLKEALEYFVTVYNAANPEGREAWLENAAKTLEVALEESKGQNKIAAAAMKSAFWYLIYKKEHDPKAYEKAWEGYLETIRFTAAFGLAGPEGVEVADRVTKGFEWGLDVVDAAVSSPNSASDVTGTPDSDEPLTVAAPIQHDPYCASGSCTDAERIETALRIRAETENNPAMILFDGHLVRPGALPSSSPRPILGLTPLDSLEAPAQSGPAAQQNGGASTGPSYGPWHYVSGISDKNGSSGYWERDVIDANGFHREISRTDPNGARGNSSASNDDGSSSTDSNNPMIDPKTGQIYKQWQRSGQFEVSSLGDDDWHAPTVSFFIPPDALKPKIATPIPDRSGASSALHGDALKGSLPKLRKTANGNANSTITGLKPSGDYDSRISNPSIPTPNISAIVPRVTVPNVHVPTVSVPTVSAPRVAVPTPTFTPPRVNIPSTITGSDIRLKRDVVELGRLPNGLHLYRYRYLWSRTVYVGVMAQEVAELEPEAVAVRPDGYLGVDYSRLGLRLLTWKQWLTRRHSPAM